MKLSEQIFKNIINKLRMSRSSDLETAMIKFAKTFEQYRNEKITVEKFSDGHIFATMLRSATNFKLKYGDLVENCEKWTFRLNNLKKVIGFIEDYFEMQIKKGIKTKDIDLIEIAKNYNQQQIIKMFELVMAVLTEAPNKQDHINTIMSLDEKSQGSFVELIQNLLQNRIMDNIETKQDKMVQAINQLQLQNSLLKNQVQNLLIQNHHQDKQIQQLKNRQADYIEQINKLRDQQMDKTHILHEEPKQKQKQHLRIMLDNLKQKLIATVRESQIKISGLKQQVHTLESKCIKYEEMQEQLQDYKRKYHETIQSYGRARLWERQKNKLTRTIQQKEDLIKKLNAKIDELNEFNYAMQERQVYAKMELQKRDVRFKQLEKQVKKRYNSTNSLNLNENNFISSKSLQLSNPTILGNQINQIDQQEIEELRAEVEQYRKKNRESDRQINRLKRNLQKATNLEADKKKLQRLILDLNTEKREQVEVLLSTTYDFYSENQKLRSLLLKNGITV